jgi:hypothetical protein
MHPYALIDLQERFDWMRALLPGVDVSTPQKSVTYVSGSMCYLCPRVVNG